MANCGKDILIKREGTEQQQRFIDALSPEYFKLNEFSLNDWMKFAYDFAEHVNYFETTDFQNHSGNWQDFFTSEKGLDDFLKAFDSDPNTLLREVKTSLRIWRCSSVSSNCWKQAKTGLTS